MVFGSRTNSLEGGGGGGVERRALGVDEFDQVVYVAR